MAEQKNGWSYFFAIFAAFSITPILAQNVLATFDDLLQEYRLQLWFWVVQLALVAISGIAALQFLDKYFRPKQTKQIRGFNDNKNRDPGPRNPLYLGVGLLCLASCVAVITVFCVTVLPTILNNSQDKQIRLSADPIEVVIGKHTKIDCLIRGSVEGVPAGYHLAWEVTPDVGAAFDLRTQTFTPTSEIADGESVLFKVALRNGLGIDVSQDSACVVVLHRPQYILNLTPTSIFPNETASFQLTTRDGSPLDPSYQFEWTRSDVDGLIENQANQLELVGKEAGDIQVTVTVRTNNGKTLGKFHKTLNIKDSRFHTSMVLDASTRMNEEMDSGENLLEIAKAELAEQIRESETVGGYIGLTVFGDSNAANQPEPCQHLSNFPVDRDYNNLQIELESVESGVKEAPLLNAIHRATRELERIAEDNSRRKLIVVTGGPDNCEPDSRVQNFLDKLRQEYEIEVDFNVRYPKFVITYCPDAAEYGSWVEFIALQQKSERGPIVFPTQNVEEFRSLVQSTVLLEDHKRNLSKTAFETLKRFANENLKDARAVQLLDQYEYTFSR